MSKRGFIFLTGFMGTGKSTVGRQLAKLLGMPFVEMDEEIERATGMKIKDIFEQYGEDFFRQKETEVLKTITKGSPAVVSTGGGIVIKDENRNLMKNKGKVICLWADIDSILQRTSGSKDRPLLNVADRRQKVQELLSSRLNYYKEADIHIQTKDKSPFQIALEIKETLNLFKKTRGKTLGATPPEPQKK